MTKRPEHLPRSAKELEEIADYYVSHDTARNMTDGTWVAAGIQARRPDNACNERDQDML